MSRRSVYMPGHSHSRTRGSRVARMLDQVATTDTSKYVDNVIFPCGFERCIEICFCIIL